MPRRSAALAATAVALAAAAAAPGGAAAPAPVRWGAPVLMSDGRAAKEISLVLNPRDERQMFACTPAALLDPDVPQSTVYRTTDGGRSWRYVDVEPAGDARESTYEGADCDVAYDAAGTVYVADTWVGNLSVGASRDGGATWTGTPLAVSVPIVDRPWIVGGAAGTVYVTYQALQGQMPTLMWFTKSTDYGKTFSPAVPITTANADGTYTWEGNLVAHPNGRDLYQVHIRKVTPADPLAEPLNDSVQLATSRDGGLTWSTRTIAPLPERTSPETIYPIVAMDAGGHLHAAWSASRAAEKDVPVYYTTSRDAGLTWSKPLMIGAGRHERAPWVAGGPRAGQAAIAWLDTPDDPLALDEPPRWYAGYATLASGRVTATGTTTRTPLAVGPNPSYAEFQAIRYGRDGRLHVGLAVQRDGKWVLYYQRQR